MSIISVKIHSRKRGRNEYIFQHKNYLGFYNGVSYQYQEFFVPPDATFANYTRTFTTNPFTGIAWQTGELEALKVYYASLGDNRTAWKLGTITTWIYVELVEDTGSTFYYLASDATWSASSYPGSGYTFAQRLSDFDAPDLAAYVYWYGTTAGTTTASGTASLVKWPTVTTEAATNVKATSATGNGTITDVGDAPVTAHGVCWNKTGTPTVADDHTDEGGSGAVSFTSEMTGLDTGDLYYYRAYATNAYGTSYGSEETFTPDYTVPSLTTNDATGEAAASASLNGTLDDDGGLACDCGFEYGETVAYGNTTPTQSRTTGQIFQQAISGLDPNTNYHFRAFATNAVGTSYGADKTFTTLGVAPTVTTNAPSGIGQTGARLNGVIDDDGGLSCSVYFEFGLTTTYGTTTTVQTAKITGDTFDELLYGLQPGKEYHFRAIAYNSQGTTYGQDRTFHMASLSYEALKDLNRSNPLGRSET
jgi:hypothetical protein